MLYDYKTEELVQDVVLEDIEILVDDIVEEFYSLRRYNELDIYTPSHIAREIITLLLEEVDEVWVHADSHNDLLYKDDNEVIITIANDGMIFVEEARGKNRELKDNEGCSLSYIYDGFGQKDINRLAANAESILVFGFEEEEIEISKNEFNAVYKETEKKAAVSTKSVTAFYTTSPSIKSSYFVNEKPVSKEEFDKQCSEFEGNIRDILLRYCELIKS